MVFAPPLVSALADLQRLRGISVSHQRLMAGLPGGFVPPTVEQCLGSAEKAGLKTRVLKRPDPADIPAAALPCVLLLGRTADGQAGACVLQSIKDGAAHVVLPETGPESTPMPVEELKALYSGYAVFALRSPRKDARAESFALLRPRHWFWDVLRDYAPIYRDVGIASLVVNLLTLGTPLFIMNVYDRVVPNNAVDSLWVLLGGLLLALGMDFVLRNARGHFVDAAGRNADVLIAGRLMDRVLRMRLDKKPESVGALVNNLREFEQVRDFFGSTTLLSLFDLPFLLIFVLIIALIGGPLVCPVLLAVPLMLGCVALLQMPFQRSIERQFKQNMQKNALLTEIVSGLETVKSLQARGCMQNIWENAVDASAEEAARGRRLASLASTATLLITGMINASVIVWGVYRIADGLMTQGGLIACVILAGRSLGPLMRFAGMISNMQKARMALRGLEVIMELPVEGGENSGETQDASSLRPEISAERVSFYYGGNTVPALRDLSLKISPGERVAFIGRTGSGKSTLARLLAGLYQPNDGAVSLGGVDMRQINPADLRARIGFMPQDNYLFYGSVRENIAMGCPWLDMSGVALAAELSGAADFIKRHPKGYDLPVGERGQALSGGQRQAVALARTLAGTPDIVILDEPSSNLDMEAEHQLMIRLKNALKDKTLLIMTHRPSLLALAERVVILRDGMIVADGPREAVIKALNEGKISLGQQHAA